MVWIYMTSQCFLEIWNTFRKKHQVIGKGPYLFLFLVECTVDPGFPFRFRTFPLVIADVLTTVSPGRFCCMEGGHFFRSSSAKAWLNATHQITKHWSLMTPCLYIFWIISVWEGGIKSGNSVVRCETYSNVCKYVGVWVTPFQYTRTLWFRNFNVSGAIAMVPWSPTRSYVPR